MEGNRPQGQTVFKAEPHFKPDGLLVLWCNRESHSFTTKAVVRKCEFLSSGNLTVFLSLTGSSIPSSERVSRDAAGSPPRAVNRQPLDLGDVVVGEKSLLSTQSSCPPPGGI